MDEKVVGTVFAYESFFSVTQGVVMWVLFYPIASLYLVGNTEEKNRDIPLTVVKPADDLVNGEKTENEEEATLDNEEIALNIEEDQVEVEKEHVEIMKEKPPSMLKEVLFKVFNPGTISALMGLIGNSVCFCLFFLKRLSS